jgi:hypothetical protein
MEDAAADSERIDSLAPARFDPPQAGLPIYVARVPAAPFASSWPLGEIG